MEPQGYRLPGCKDSMAFAFGEHQLPKLSRFPRRCVSPHVPGSPGAASLLKANRLRSCHRGSPGPFWRLNGRRQKTILTSPFAFC